MIAMKAGTQRVPGANLHYEVRGSGPILLLIHPAGGDARAFDAIAGKLAGRYTVMAYDRRGLSRSRLGGPDKQRHDEIRETYRQDGAFAALQKIVAQASPGFDDREPEVEVPSAPDVLKDRLANAEFLFAHELDMYDRFQPDMGALSAVADRVVIAGGRVGRELVGYRSAAGWAQQLGTPVVDFPGGHVGYRTHPRAFVERLLEVLGRRMHSA